MKFFSPRFAGNIVLAIERRSSRLAFLLAVFLIIFAAQALAQDATIVGTVTDPSGAAVSTASITITNTDTGVSRTAPTSSDGQYVAPDLRAGHYVMRATAVGVRDRDGCSRNGGPRRVGHGSDDRGVLGQGLSREDD